MSNPREALTEMVADIVAEHFERLRAEVFSKMLALRTPKFAITPKGELYCDGELAGDIRPVFQRAVREALKDMHEAAGDGDDGPG